MQIKITLDPKIAEKLNKKAKAMGLKLHEYIKMRLGNAANEGE